MNVILTGERQIGKSTALKKILGSYKGEISGFYTRFSEETSGVGRRLLIMDAKGGRQTEVVRWENHIPVADIEAFDRAGCEFLSEKGDLTVMDELGRFEKDALCFKAAVEAAFDSNRPVLAVVRLDAVGWMQETKKRSDVSVITVTKENRDSVPNMVLSLLSK